jgi:pimeloyl-ACP methyl ester carboxylesterase
MRGKRHTVSGAGGVPIGLLTAGTGRPLLLVHGGMSCIEAWKPIWPALVECWRVTAMDRRGRGTSGDAEQYTIDQEYDDIAVIAADLGEQQVGPVDVFAHSYGGDVRTWSRSSRRAISPPRALRAPRATDQPPSVAANGRHAGHRRSPRAGDGQLPHGPWASQNTYTLAAALANANLVILPGQGHEAVQSAPDMIVAALQRFLADDRLSPPRSCHHSLHDASVAASSSS